MDRAAIEHEGMGKYTTIAPRSAAGKKFMKLRIDLFMTPLRQLIAGF
jgi:hypothetical protein